MLYSVTSVDDLYLFFDKRLPEANSVLTNLQLTGSQSVIVTGSQLDLFLRRCILSFK
jgi:hypothetical protein